MFIMAIAAAFTYGYAHRTLLVNGDAMQTLKNIQESGAWFELEILGWLVVMIEDLLVS
nr:DUF4386 family protein [Ornithinibacillus caprae]